MEIVEGLYVVAEGSLSASTNQLQSHTSLLHLTYYREFLCFESYHSSTKEPNIRHGKLIILSLDYCRTLQTTASELLYMDLNSTIIDLLMDNHKKKNSTSLLRAGEGPRRRWDYGYECPLLTSFNPQADPLTDRQCCGSLAVISLAVIGGNCKKLLPRWRLKTYQVILLLLNFLAK